MWHAFVYESMQLYMQCVQLWRPETSVDTPYWSRDSAFILCLFYQLPMDQYSSLMTEDTCNLSECLCVD